MYRKTGSSASRTDKSGLAVNATRNEPSEAVVAVPWAICCDELVAYQRDHQAQIGYRTPRTTRHSTSAPPIDAPVYAVATPGTTTGSLSRGASSGAVSST